MPQSASHQVCDGGPNLGWKLGWNLFDLAFGDVGVSVTAAKVGENVLLGRLYNSSLYTSEVVGNWRAGVSA